MLVLHVESTGQSSGGRSAGTPTLRVYLATPVSLLLRHPCSLYFLFEAPSTLRPRCSDRDSRHFRSRPAEMPTAASLPHSWWRIQSGHAWDVQHRLTLKPDIIQRSTFRKSRAPRLLHAWQNNSLTSFKPFSKAMDDAVGFSESSHQTFLKTSATFLY